MLIQGIRITFSKVIFLFTLCFFGANAFAESSGELAEGEIDATEILQSYEKFNKEYQRYEVTNQQLDYMQVLKGKSLLVLFGSWCHDSQREVPRLLKLISESKVELSELKLVAVDLDKEDKLGLSKQHELRYTPTFIVFDNEEEVARIIERPNTDLATDFYRLLSE